MKMEPSNVRKKRELSNVTKEQLHVILDLHNVKMEPLNVTKVQSHVMLELHNVRIKTVKCEKK